MVPVTGDRELSSWKEIAAYLGVGVRTAQEWERTRGLPVRRLPGPRGRVISSVAELDNWKTGTTNGAPGIRAPESSGPRFPAWRFLAIGALVLVVAGFSLAHFWRAEPASARVEGNSLVVSDAGGQVLWRRSFPYPLSGPSPLAGSLSTVSWVVDLDGDGHNEVLFVPIPADGRVITASTPLICYSDRGAERWRYTPSRRVRTSVESFEPLYGIPQFVVAPLGPQGSSVVVLLTRHYLYYPSQVVMLSRDGSLLREYWHSGQLSYLEVGELRGKPVLYVAGISNAWKAATLIVLDPNDFGGASLEPEAPAYALLDFPAGREVQRAIFGRTCLNRAFNPWNGVYRMAVHQDEIMVETQELYQTGAGEAGVIHHLAPDLSGHHADVSDSYQNEYRRAQMNGWLSGCENEDRNAVRLLR